ncbi:MAG: hypothetical protein MJ183_07035 [Treponemataceae bacterium]|nr:hypothetical protein [Treponemataceae bacterium]
MFLRIWEKPDDGFGGFLPWRADIICDTMLQNKRGCGGNAVVLPSV